MSDVIEPELTEDIVSPEPIDASTAEPTEEFGKQHLFDGTLQRNVVGGNDFHPIRHPEFAWRSADLQRRLPIR